MAAKFNVGAHTRPQKAMSVPVGTYKRQKPDASSYGPGKRVAKNKSAKGTVRAKPKRVSDPSVTRSTSGLVSTQLRSGRWGQSKYRY
jgi:hypothetical protein